MVPMPAVVVLILCKTVVVGPPDQNVSFTHSENRDWATENSMMVCRRQEVEVIDVDVDKGADPQPFTTQRCFRSAMVMGPAWDIQHRNSPYRFWKVACPVPIVKQFKDEAGKLREEIIAWKLPDCGHRDTVVCEVDTAI
jgi:hypothetical protein